MHQSSKWDQSQDRFLHEIYAIEVSPDLISEVTDAVVAEVTAWQVRPLEPLYPVVFSTRSE